MAVSTVGEYLSALEKSKLLNSEQLAKARSLAAESPDPATLAKALARENLVSRWQASTLLALGKRAQLRLGKYRLIQPLGKGGMGTVFLAEHVTMSRRVALKIVPLAIAKDRASLDRFFAEARAIAALDHPNIVQAYSVDNEMDRYFIVMEFVDGQDLQRVVEVNGPMDFDRAADYIRQAAEGLAHAHARNLVHCDIKPSNLLVNPQGVLKILDLGLARLKKSDEPPEASGASEFGTVDYMPPEQALQASNFDHRADIYSLGCTLYFLLTGHPPFPEGTLAQRIVKHQTQEPRDILLDRPNAPTKLVGICKRMMAKEPEKRFQTMQEVSAALGPRQAQVNVVPPPIRGPQLVKALDEAPADASGDDWLISLAGPLPGGSAGGSSGGMKAVAATATKSGGHPAVKAAMAKALPVQIGRQPGKKGKSGAAVAATTGAWALLPWFNSVPRKIAGIAGGASSLVAVVGVASYLAFSNGRAAPPVTQQAVQEEKTGTADVVPSTDDKSSDNKKEAKNDRALPRPDSHDKHIAVSVADAPRPKQSAEKPVAETPKPETVKPANKPDAPELAKVDLTPTVKPAEPRPKPVPRAVETPISLDGMMRAVDLPMPGKGGTDVVPLGTAEIDPAVAIDLQLLGGETVARGNPKFELQKEGEPPTRDWSVQMTEKGKAAVKAARIWQEDNDFKFQWDSAAKDKASQLRYCTLHFSCKNKMRNVPMTTVKNVRSLEIEFERGVIAVRMGRDFPLPDASTLRLQILPLDKMIPKHEIKVQDVKQPGVRPKPGKSGDLIVGNTMPVPGRGEILITKDRTPPVALNIGVKSQGNKDLAVEMVAMTEITDLDKLVVACNDPSLQNVFSRVTKFIEMNDGANPRSGVKLPGQVLDAYKRAKDRLVALRDMCVELNKKTAVQFQVYAVVGEGAPDVLLFQSVNNWTEAPKPAVKKPAKANGSKAQGGTNSDNEELKLP